MDNLYAPWRGVYVTGEKEEGCVFCAKFGRDKDREDLILHRGKHCAVVMNLYPYNNGHLMVLPLRHVANLDELSSEEAEEFHRLTKAMITILRKVIAPQGFNIGINMGSAAGAGIAAHLHQHIVPRWVGDTNFMPVIAESKVISETLLTGYDRLKQAIDENI
jgi:ATP adenylyltransferase